MFVITGLGVGGAENQLQKITGQLKRFGWEVTVCALHGGEEMQSRLEDDGVAVRLAPAGRGPFKPFRWFRWLQKEVRASGPDCLVSFMLQANVLTRIAGRMQRIPVIASIRNSRFGGSSRLGQRTGDLLERLTTHLSVTTVVNSRFATDELIRRRVLREEDITVIVNGLEVPPRRTPEQPGSGPFRWFTAGRLTAQKNHRQLLIAFARLLEQGRNVELHIAGEGPLERELKDLAGDLGVTARVEFLGLQLNIGEHMCAADGFVLASLWEGMPNVIMEAMAAGVPVVATDVGGVAELITDCETGILVEPGTPEALARGMVRLMDMESETRRLLTEQAYNLIDARFSLTETAEKWRTLISQTADSRS